MTPRLAVEPSRRGPAPGATNKYDRAEIARIAIAAFRGRPMSLAVAEHYGVETYTARRLIISARRDGYPIPPDLNNWAGRPGSAIHPGHAKRYKPPTGLCLICACGHIAPITVLVMQRHTLTVHGRQPSRSERTPQRVDEAA
mgnify:CR=1 FL=1